MASTLQVARGEARKQCIRMFDLFINLQMTLRHLSGKMWLQIPEAAIATSDVVRIQIDRHIKKEASNLLVGIGLSISDAIRILLTRIATDKALTSDVNRGQHQTGIKRPRGIA